MTDYIISDEKLTLGIREKDRNIFLFRIYDKITETDFIESVTENNSLWEITVKKDRDFFGEKIKLVPGDCETVRAEKTEKSVCFHFENVKKPFMKTGFDVDFSVCIEDGNSYWKIKTGTNEEYGIWSVACPRINDLDAHNGNVFLLPFHGTGFPVDKFTENGFTDIMDRSHTKYTKEFGYWYPHGMQFCSFSKGKSALYLSAEDETFMYKYIGIDMLEPYHLNYFNVYEVEGKAIAGRPFENTCAFNMSSVKGDWYHCAKKYRKWNLEKQTPAVRRGLIEDRPDIPQWLKKTVYWFRVHCYMENCFDSLNRSIEYMKVQPSIHFYQWPIYKYDTHYPTWLPQREGVDEEIEYLRKKGIGVMLYTNAHLIDTNLNESYKKYGDELLALNEHGGYVYEDWAKDDGACNKDACMGSEYYNILKEEYIRIMKTLKPDAFYMDQVGGACHPFCFNTNHNHLPGGGDFPNRLYNKFIKEIKEEFKKIKGCDVPIATEEIIEPLDFDLWLHVNDPMGENENYPLTQTVYSGYTVNYGDWNRKTEEIDEWKDDDSYPSRNKTAISLVSGNMFGWNEGSEYEVFNEKFGTYFKAAAKAREYALPYFNFGELVRKANITSLIPTRKIKFMHWTGLGEFDFPLVKTGSFYYKGKTLIVFTNISLDRKISVSWQADPKDLNLSEKSEYRITQIYPKTDISQTLNKIENDFIISPIETVLFEIE